MTYEKLLHIDLFSGIGGFALAAERVFGNVEHIFCDIEPFAQEVLKKHRPESRIFGDIRTLTQDSVSLGRTLGGDEEQVNIRNKRKSRAGNDFGVHILTGGFPCQPFSQAGRRRGEEDDRFLWPEMLRVIREFSPLWVIAENVRGLLTQGGGVVFERICTDLEAAGYEVQPLIIPAVAVGAPHRRDRVWIVGHSKGTRRSGTHDRQEKVQHGGTSTGRNKQSCDAPDATNNDWRGRQQRGNEAAFGTRGNNEFARSSWDANWLEVATRLCRVDDGVRTWVDGCGKVRNSRNARLKALGNAIVPQVAEEIMRAIRQS